MVDIHSHILYGLDDGAKSFEESLAMLELAAESGTTDIVATPHADLRFPYRPELIQQRIQELQAHVGDRIRIHRGCDFHLHFDNIQSCLRNPALYTINGKRYLMVEFANQKIPHAISEVFGEMLRRDMIPVITHPERNRLLMERIPQLIAWVRLGCLIQVTADSFLGSFGKPAESACRQLVAQKLVHFAASDAHDTTHRPPDMRAAYDFVSREYGEDSARRFFIANPGAALAGEDIECDDPEELRSTRPWYRFW